ncbi:glycosyltransferase [Fervidobacterium pennivorans]|uniref:glycosyltransferase n=1 Tax=Fervidobacterium pennivorans TaxID=93466 RepID=UPI001436C372|nr:glycosyltransferase [Fervidobacterium pennivorans]QIV77631.1 glycosyltransferase family 4 protein [Fervidobacterium pennivorans subsp. keratinolyticus]
MAKKRVLQVITRSDWAGGQKVLYSLVYGFKHYYPDEFEIEVACGKYDGTLIPKLQKLGIKVHIVEDLVREISPIKDIKAFLQLRKIIKQGKYDVVHLHSSKAGFLGRVAAKLSGVPVVVYTVHGWWGIEQYKGIKRKLFILAERIAAKFCDKIVFLCKRELDKARSWKIGKESQYKIIANAIVPIENIQKGQLRKELGIPDSVKIIGNVARLDPQKNPIRFLEIAKLVLSERDDVVFVWIGGSVVDDYYGKEVQKWLEDNSHLKEKIYFLPFREDAIQLMADFDVLLLTSDSEGMPLVVLEALSLGVPVVSTDVGCVNETISSENIAVETQELANKTIQRLKNIFSFKVGVTRHANHFDGFILSYKKIYK